MIEIDGTLTIEEVTAVARDGERVELADDARDRLAASRKTVEDIVASKKRVYGVNTGYGNLKDIAVDADALEQQQRNLLRSHAVAVGDPYSTDTVRAMLVVRANALALGRSGVRPLLVDRLIDMLNEGVHPVIRSRGNTDNACALAPVGLVLIGEGEATVDGERVSGDEALAAAGLDPIEIAPREGLAIISGTTEMTALSALSIDDLRSLVIAADIAGAWTMSLVGKEPGAFDERVTDARPFGGHAESAATVRSLLPESVGSGEDMSQDPLSIRCLPQVHGTLREYLDTARDIVETELTSATGNPLIFPDGTTLSCGNFNGQHVAGIADLLSLTAAKVAHACERRAGVLLDAWEKLPAHLATDPGLESGMSRVHYAAASLATDAASVGTASERSFVASSGQEDLHASGVIAANKLTEVVILVSRVVAAELLCAARASQLGSSNLSEPLLAVLNLLETRVGLPLEDAVWDHRLESVGDLLLDGEIEATVADAGADL
ncbi:histidine ammonia-lyase [Halosolutus amylolyticus]|uniref:Histidine ammonia-lyase n=1 Tax=Halosolutus amylolyticus TaxID=2932267 RepID=A0ABD5PJ87_9EURY|nr:aromatic amino acid ammonia-lyase [Halosolutus amylolyticus]